MLQTCRVHSQTRKSIIKESCSPPVHAPKPLNQVKKCFNINHLLLNKPRVAIVKTLATSSYSNVPLGGALGKEYVDYAPNPSKERRAGVILHPTSLPGPYGIGEFSDEAYKFIDWLDSAGFRCWQILPLVPPDPMFFSPYSGTDSNCGNPLLISLQHLVREGLLEPSELPPEVPVGNCDFAQVAIVKNPLLKKASARLLKDPRFRNLHNEYLKFRTENPWIEDSAIFDVARNLDEFKELAWWDWPEDIRFHKREALDKFREQYKDEIDEFIVTQYTFNKQWLYIRKYANSKGIQIVGDMPIYVGGHSSDVWANQHLFELGANGKPENVSGVPPDAFSATGQLWGSPLYRWDAHAKESYSWWVTRLYRAAELYDLTRVDHFRGFAGYWSVAAHETTAMNGEWRKGPGADLFNRVRDKLGSVPILAEDLGVITEDVVQLRESIEAPGMVVLQFAWGSDSSNVHLPHNHKPSSFCYTGTHDNETTRGWFSGLPEDALDRKTLKDYFGVESDEQAAPYLIRAAMLSVSETAVVPMQDILGLDNTARMNTPGKAEGNWRWRIGDAKVIWPLLSAIAGDYRKLHQIANRLPPSTASAEGGASNENK